LELFKTTERQLMNLLNIAGNVGKDSELRQVNTQSGSQSVLSFPVAVKSSKKGQDGKYLSTWFDCTLWGKQADALAQYIKKGSAVAVAGEVELEQYTAKDGSAGAKMKLNAQKVTLLGGNQQSAPQQQSQQQPAQPARQAPPQGYQPQYGNQPTGAAGGIPQQNRGPMEPPIDFDDDLPF
jgi:single-strand DNA-binding protein